MKYNFILSLLLLLPFSAHAEGWNDELYKQIENSIKCPEFKSQDRKSVV